MGCGNSTSGTIPIKTKTNLTKDEHKGEWDKTAKQTSDYYVKWWNELEDKNYFKPENIGQIRQEYEYMTDEECNKEYWKQFTDACTNEWVTIKGAGGQDMTFQIVKAKKNAGKKSLPGILYCHGGGGYSLHPRHETYFLARMATESDVVFFSLDYRLAPETKAPGGYEDCIVAMNHLLGNAEKFCLDTTRFCMGGTSGGGYIALGTQILMQKKGIKNPFKTLFLLCPMLDTINGEVEEWEIFQKPISIQEFKLHATDYEAQDKANDTLLFPGRISVQDARKLPGVVLQTSERDSIRRSTHDIIPTLKKAGVYLDHMDYAGVDHGFMMTSSQEKKDLFFVDMAKAIQAYVM